MSLFATLRKKGKKLTFIEEKEEMKQKQQIQNGDASIGNASANSTSTPNLYKIKPDVQITYASSKEYLDKEGGDKFEMEGLEDESHLHSNQGSTRILGSHHRRFLDKSQQSSIGSGSSGSNISNYSSSNPSIDASSSTLPRLKRNRAGTGKFVAPTSGGLARFMSMMSMVSYRNSKKNKEFGSVTHLRPTDAQHIKSGSLNTKRESSVFYTSPIPSPSSSPSAIVGATARIVQQRKNSQSVPNIHSLSRKFSKRKKNMEPGVGSSSGSGSSCANSTDSGSFRDFKEDSLSRTDSFTKLCMCKTPEEVERDKLMLQGIKKFNTDPKKGIDLLIENGFVERTPESVAQYLKDGEGLSKSAVGNYLGEHHDFNIQVLKAFVNLHDFTDVLLVQALRQFLWSFRLPGEAQKIDRMMESFANRYCQLNSTLFKTPDTCYILSYAIIMLNTSLHNVNVKDKPSVEQFIRMNRDIDGGDSLNTNFIVQLYNSIQAEPFKIPPEDGNDLMLTFFNPDIEGWLWKQGERYKRWKRRWFILSNNCLYYFKFTTDKVPRGIIPLENIIVKLTNERTGKQFSFSLHKQSQDSRLTDYIKSCKTLSDGQTVPGRHSAYHLATASEKERERWMTAISQNSSTHSFYTFLAEKKRNLQALVDKERSGSIGRKSRKKSTIVRKSQIGLPLTRNEAYIEGGISSLSPSPSPSPGPSPHLLHPAIDNEKHSRKNKVPSGSSSVNDSNDEENDEAEGHNSESDSISQISFEANPLTRRFSEMEVRVPPVGLGNDYDYDTLGVYPTVNHRLSRNSSLPMDHRVTQIESLLPPQIRVTTSRDGLVGSGSFNSSFEEIHNDSSGISEKLSRIGNSGECKTEFSESTAKCTTELPRLSIPKYSVDEMAYSEGDATPMPTFPSNMFTETAQPFSLFGFENSDKKFFTSDSQDKINIESYDSVHYSNLPQIPQVSIIDCISENESIISNPDDFTICEERVAEISENTEFPIRQALQEVIDKVFLENLAENLSEFVPEELESITSATGVSNVTSEVAASSEDIPPEQPIRKSLKSKIPVAVRGSMNSHSRWGHSTLSFPVKRNSTINLRRKKSLEKQILEIKVKQKSITNEDPELPQISQPLPIFDSISTVTNSKNDSSNNQACGISGARLRRGGINTSESFGETDYVSSQTACTISNSLLLLESEPYPIKNCENSSKIPNLPNIVEKGDTIIEAHNSILINSVRHTDV